MMEGGFRDFFFCLIPTCVLDVLASRTVCYILHPDIDPYSMLHATHGELKLKSNSFPPVSSEGQMKGEKKDFWQEMAFRNDWALS